MNKPNKVVVIGGSAGGIPALCEIIQGLRSDLAAALVVVNHRGPEPGRLSQVFRRYTDLKVIDAKPAQPLEPGTLYLAPANRHAVLRDGCIFAVPGPRENRHRPSVDVLFRSAARAWRADVIAVVLSGVLDDGSAGALAVKSRGGRVIVQDPDLAEYSAMPANVVRHVGADYCLPAGRIAALITRLVGESRDAPPPRLRGACRALVQDWLAQEKKAFGIAGPSGGGALIEAGQGGLTQSRHPAGPAHSLKSFSAAEAEVLERAIWIAYRELNEHRTIQLNLAQREPKRASAAKSRYAESAAAATRDLEMLCRILARF